MALQGFGYADVVLGEGPFNDGFEANRRYLHALDSDRLLYVFRRNAGLEAPGEPLGGWESPDCLLRGHFVGHYLSACARTFAACKDFELKAKADRMVSELRECQLAFGNGYLEAIPETIFDILEGKQQGRIWAPYYIVHKVMVGLLDMYLYTGNEEALTVLKDMADYFKRRTDALPEQKMQDTLRVEFGGMSEVLYDLYSVTGEQRYFDLAKRFEQRVFFEPLAAGQDNLTGLHVNTHIPKILGAARAYELTGDQRYRTIATRFWDLVANTRSYATGGTSVGEHWREPNKLKDTLTADTEESCTSYNWLKLCRYLMRWTGDARYGDMYERNLFNGILGTQDPETGMLIYFLPLKSGARKRFGGPNDSFWCCYGTGVQSFASFGNSIYFHDDSSILVNLFISSNVAWRVNGQDVRVAQSTRFPEEDGTRITVLTRAPVQFDLKVRVPYWASGGCEVTVNGKPVQTQAAPQSVLTIGRKWANEDAVDVRFPMSLHAQPINDDPELVAFMYGPIVLAGLVDGPSYLVADTADPASLLRPVPNAPLTFETRGQARNVKFMPLYKVMDERYGVYFEVLKPGSERLKAHLAAEEARRQREARVVDRVLIKDAESEKAHNLQGQLTDAGEHPAGNWRHARPGGWFSYDLQVDSVGANVLWVTYWGSDVPPRTFEILVDGQKIATQSLDRNKPGELFDIEHALPLELTNGKKTITARFVPQANNTAGGIFGLAILRAR